MPWAPEYATATELAAYVRIDDTLDDVQIGLAIAAASRAVDDATGRQFGLDDAPTARYYTARFDYAVRRWGVDLDDLTDDTSVTVMVDDNGDGMYDVEVTDYRLAPVNAAAKGRPWTRLEVSPHADVDMPTTAYAVEVNAAFGWQTVPDTVKKATLLQASRFLQRRDAPFGIAGSPDQGSEIRLLARVDPDVHVMLAPYRRHRLKVG